MHVNEFHIGMSRSKPFTITVIYLVFTHYMSEVSVHQIVTHDTAHGYVMC